MNSSAAVSVFFSSEVTARCSIIRCLNVDSLADEANHSLRMRISFILSGSGVGVSCCWVISQSLLDTVYCIK